MRRLPSLLLALLAACALAVAAAGCGDEELPDVSAAEAADSTRDEKTARVTMSMKMTGLGTPRPIEMAGEGVTAIAEPRMDITFDLTKMLESFGQEGEAKFRFLLEGGRLYIDPPDIEGLEIPEGADWVTADLGAVAEAASLDASGLGDLMRLTPEQQMAALEAAGTVKEVGEEEIDGVPTTRLRGTVKMSDYLSALPADRRKRAQDALDRLEELGGEDLELDEPTPVEMWVDEDSLLRRMTSTAKMPPQDGVPAGEVSITMSFTDFGTELDVDPPSGDDVYDATDDLKDAVASGAFGG